MQSGNFVAGSFSISEGSSAPDTQGAGMKIDLSNGQIDAHNLVIRSNNVYLSSKPGATTYFVIKSNNKKNFACIKYEYY